MDTCPDTAHSRARRFKAVAERLEKVFGHVPDPVAAIARNAWMVSMNGFMHTLATTTPIASEEDAEAVRRGAQEFAPTTGGDVADLLELIADWIESCPSRE